MSKNYIFSSESVGEGHPDKVCDTISDAILDACLTQDPRSRVACETFVKTGMVLIGFSPTTAALMLETGAPSISRAGVDDLPLAAADLDGGKNNLGCGFAGSEPCPGRPASNFGFGTGEANAGASDSAGEGPVSRVVCTGGVNTFG